ncbi:MAG: nitroreductase family protein, partial [Bdellovibrio sp.]
MSSALEILKQRTSANNFDKTKTISEADIKELVSFAIEAPSSFNIQHWRFIAVNQKDVQEKLKAAAYGQAKVSDAAVTFVILGDLKGIDKLPEAISPMLKAGAIDQKAYDGWLA